MAENEQGGMTPPYYPNSAEKDEQGGMTPPYYPNSAEKAATKAAAEKAAAKAAAEKAATKAAAEKAAAKAAAEKAAEKAANKKYTNLIKSRRAAQVAAHKKRLNRTIKRIRVNKQKKAFFETAKKPKNRLAWKTMSRKERKRLEKMKKNKKEEQIYNDEFTITKFLRSISNNPDSKIRDLAKKYYAEKAEGIEGNTLEAKAKRNHFYSLYLATVSLESSFKELAKIDFRNAEEVNDYHEGLYNLKMARVSSLAREEAAKVIKEKIKEAKTKKENAAAALGAGAGAAAESDELNSLLEKMQGMKL